MGKRIPLWAAAVVWVVTLAVGVWAQKPEKPAPASPYPYLPAKYGQIHMPSVAEWLELRFNVANGSTTRITQHFLRRHLKCSLRKDRLILTMDLEPMPSWKFYEGQGKFSGDQKRVEKDISAAIDTAIKTTKQYFPEVKDKDIALLLFMNSEIAGQWDGGKLGLGRSKVGK